MRTIATTFAGSRPVLVGLVALLVQACASIGDSRVATSSETDSGASRAERVFLYQSRVANALLDRYPLVEVLEDADPEVTAAEARMTESCSALTQAVLMHFEGVEPPLALRFRVMRTLDDCERAARAVDEMLHGFPVAGSI